MNPAFYTITCVSCGKNWKEEETSTKCLDCNSALEVIFDYDHIQTNLNEYVLKNAPPSAMKYLDFYPIKDRKKIVSLQEGNTPLYHAKKMGEKRGLPKLYIKNEGGNPTGVFKDRGSLVEITKALELNAKAIVVASTGNMAASVSAYAGKAGIPCYVLIPEGTPIGKLSQSLAYGGTIIQIRGTYADCVHLSEKMAKKYGYYLAGDYAFRGTGHKSIGYEIIEQLSWKVPDIVIVPMGCGTNISAIWKGFKEFFDLGIVQKTPRMIGVQPENCSTIAAAFLQGKDRYVYVDKPKTVCSAVGIGEPQDDIKALRCLRESGGTAVTIDDDTVLEAQQEMAECASIFTEPSGALPIAVLEKLKEKGVITEKDIVVCVATGTGLKDPKSAVLMHAEPITVEPNIESVDAFLKSGMQNVTSGGTRGRADVIFPKYPEKEELKKVLKELFHLDPKNELFEKFQKEFKGFFEKRDEMKKSELQLFVNEFIANFGTEEKVLILENFKIETSLHEKAKATIECTFQGERFTNSHQGGGPVDAALSALKKAIEPKTGFKVHLKDYNVTIRNGGIDTTVQVNIVVQDADGNEATGTAASPDVIVGSLEAYVNGFNLLWNKQKG
ncbi:threonine synthase [Candidatus Peregrinibacteria bacterium]|nr:threonine synthase [Candidatus Peregrinibacteria bacterium]